MATTTATITLASTDIADNALNISNTATFYTAGTDTGITETTGLARKKTNSGSNTVLLDSGAGVAADVTADKSAKVYIKNINDRGDGTKFVTILLTTVQIGRLYGGDFMWMPWDADDDICIAPSTGDDMTVEYMVFS